MKQAAVLREYYRHFRFFMAEMYTIGTKQFLVIVMNKLQAQLILISAGDISTTVTLLPSGERHADMYF
jgi:hypothetical protein